ncbi:MAG: hypothetical protein FJW23_12345 [Acidimicrobiia bacterium]|nr:hypothetical protein [Acidimicrobiia bacterium]
MRNVGKAIVTVFAVIGVVSSVQHLRGQSAAPLQSATLTHIGIMVNDMEKTSRIFQEVFGVTVPAAREVGPLPLLPGTPNAEASKVRFVQFKVGDTTMELIQPVAGPGPHRDHIDKFGQGLQHLAFAVPDPKAAIQALVDRGGKHTMSSYVDLKDSLGFTAEISGPPRQ